MLDFEKYLIVWNDYIKYRADLRGYNINIIEKIIRYSSERYFDVSTHRLIVVGKHNDLLVMVPYDIINKSINPITIHATTRQQIKFRIKSGRFVYEKA